jgi:hypothetical protein
MHDLEGRLNGLLLLYAQQIVMPEYFHDCAKSVDDFVVDADFVLHFIISLSNFKVVIVLL